MNYNDYQQSYYSGSIGFPIEFHHVDRNNPHYRIPAHWHIEHEIVRVLEGQMELNLNETSVTLLKGDSAIISGGVMHSAEAEDCVYEFAVFDLNEFMRGSIALKKDIEDVRSHRIVPNGKYPAESDESRIISNIFETLKSGENGYEFVTQGLIFVLIGTVIGNRSYTYSAPETEKSLKKAEKIKGAVALIKEQYMSDLTLNDLADTAGMSPKYFCRFFSEMTGKTPIEYLNSYRIERACELLLTDGRTVTDVCMHCGFNDLSYFVKTFKKYKGITPKQYKIANVKL